MDSQSAASIFSKLEICPLDSTYALKELFLADDDARKVLLGAGVYRDNDSRPWVLPVVKKAEESLENAQDIARYEYLPITGYEPFHNAARDLLFGPLGERARHVVSVQTISGTGANHLGARFLSETLRPSSVWISSPSWVNHENIWNLVGVKTRLYPYWCQDTRALDFEEMIKKLEVEAAAGDVIVLHACAHNPTGIDPTKEQWKRIAEVCETRALFPFFDSAYQGFASGDLYEDAWAIRHFMARGTLELAVAQSFSKNMGLYGERVGALHLVTTSPDAAVKARSQITRLQRGEISQPPARGAKLATAILTTPHLFSEWLADLALMSSRIKNMRRALYEELLSLGTPGCWDHIVSQIGMFSYTGLSEKQVDAVRNDSHVYMLRSGRISIAGLNSGNVRYVAEAINASVRKISS